MFKRGLCVALLMCLAATASAQDKQPPYWASIASGEAMMRSGPGRNYPGIWLYKRRDLPIRVVQTYPNWRKIEDPDGTTGWMLVTLLSDRRTAIVKPGEPRVVGRIEQCDGRWCQIRIGKREGWIAQGDIWGVGDGEVLD
jgi:SH3-like domain-containing protein